MDVSPISLVAIVAGLSCLAPGGRLLKGTAAVRRVARSDDPELVLDPIHENLPDNSLDDDDLECGFTLSVLRALTPLLVAISL